MKLHRYFLAIFPPALKVQSVLLNAEVAGVRITIGDQSVDEQHDGQRLVTATIELPQLPVSDEIGRIVIPEKERVACESSVQHAVNLLSVVHSCSRAIYSPTPCVALGAKDKNEKDFLNSSRGILVPDLKSEWATGWRVEWTPEMGAALSDRFSGVALLAEAYTGGSESHRYREFARFFEIAFGLSFYDKRLARKLTQFLSSGAGGYERDEINKWTSLRHPSIHADLKKTPNVALSADVRTIVLRMQQACLDVLFNKVNWHDPGSTRRQIWQPDAIVTAKDGNIVVKQGTTLNVLFRVYDEFGVHPIKLGVSVDHSNDELYATYFQNPEGPKFVGPA